MFTKELQQPSRAENLIISLVLLEAGLSAGVAARATEERSTRPMTQSARSWGVPMVVEAYGGLWGLIWQAEPQTVSVPRQIV